MNMRLACDLCGSQPCMCQEFDCPTCEGEGRIEHPFLREPVNMHAECPPDPIWIDCEDCDGTGQVKCDGPRSTIPSCRFEFCHCEAAWERQQEEYASEPPMTADERHRQAWEERQALRSGRPL